MSEINEAALKKLIAHCKRRDIAATKNKKEEHLNCGKLSHSRKNLLSIPVIARI